MAYLFRVAFDLAQSIRLSEPSSELVLLDQGDVRVVITTGTEDAIRDQTRLALRGWGYPTRELAGEEGQRWMAALPIGLVCEFVGAEFGARTRSGGMSDAGLATMNASQTEVEVRNDVPGLYVGPDSPPPVFTRLTADGVATKSAEGTARVIVEAYAARVVADPRTDVAFELYSAALTMPSTDSHFLMLMSATEALIERGSKPAPQVAALDDMMAGLADRDLTTDDRNALKQALSQARDESITAAGRRLAEEAGAGQTYLGLEPGIFFRDCYAARSALVHGNISRPDIEFIRQATGPLQFLIRDMLRRRAGLPYSPLMPPAGPPADGVNSTA